MKSSEITLYHGSKSGIRGAIAPISRVDKILKAGE